MVTLLAAIAAIFYLLIMVFISYGVVMRYFFFAPVAWFTEIIEYLLLYSTMLGAAWLLEHDYHVNVDIILMRLNKTWSNLLNIITNIMGTCICFLIFWFSLQSTLMHYHRNILIINVLMLPKHYMIGIIALGFLLLTLQFARKTCSSFLKFIGHAPGVN
ncbi:MAG: TRAP transporter small permease [Bacillota bacterium]